MNRETWASARYDFAHRLLASEPVYVGEWQSQTSVSAANTTYEVLNAGFSMPMPEFASEAARIVGPGLPWAEDHFQERVGGEPLNPPPSNAWWPYAQAGNAMHKEPRKLEIPERDWAYLAAMIDGDGSISINKRREGDQGRPRIYISQKDHDFIHKLGERYPFGTVSIRNERNTTTPDGKIRRSNAAQWYVTGKAKVLWALENLEPYLILKKDKARECIDLIRSLPITHRDKLWEVEGDAQFSHTYPERMWPKFAAGSKEPRRGIRYEYGDLGDVVQLLRRSPYSRQAYLPIWSLEDTGSAFGQRVPCTLGYQFLIRSSPSPVRNELHVIYNMRSCDFMRHLADDIYMTIRLAQWMRDRLAEPDADGTYVDVRLGKLHFHAGSLHIFEPDRAALAGMHREMTAAYSQRLSSYASGNGGPSSDEA